MNDRITFGGRATAIDHFENDNEALSTGSDYGRRVEGDRSWTVYHVFTGVPANIGGITMTGLTRSKATDKMLALNRHEVVREQDRQCAERSSRRLPNS